MGRNMLSAGKIWAFSICLTLFGVGNLIAAAPHPAQDPDDGTRRVWDTDLVQKRPPAKVPAAGHKTISYKLKSSSTASGPAAKPNDKSSLSDGLSLGLTVWRLRPTKASDDKDVRILDREEESGSPTEWMPERVDATAPLLEGERIRMTIEVPRNGYLYIVDREQYADGTLSEPYLIFPLVRARGLENNAVKAGVTVEVPAQEDSKPYFKVTRSRPDQVSDTLSLIVTPEPLTGLNIGRKNLRIPTEQFETWQKQWSSQVEIHEMVGGAGKPYTKAEKAAGSGTGALTQDDPPPQTIYRLSAKPNNPVMVAVPLKISK